jgi:hypothetical protein
MGFSAIFETTVYNIVFIMSMLMSLAVTAEKATVAIASANFAIVLSG